MKRVGIFLITLLIIVVICVAVLIVNYNEIIARQQEIGSMERTISEMQKNGASEVEINKAQIEYRAILDRYNLKIATFPGNILASMFGFSQTN